MVIRFYSQSNRFKLRNKRIVKSWIKEVLNLHYKNALEINIIFTTSEYLKGINIKFLKHNYYTDVITFNNSEGALLSGEIYIDYLTVVENAFTFDVRIEKELLRVIIHGILHLIGFNDSTLEEKEIMRYQEDVALGLIEQKYGSQF